MVQLESQRFMVSLHFAYGLALLKKGSGEVTEEWWCVFVRKCEEMREIRGKGRERKGVWGGGGGRDLHCTYS